jgi:tight adherence protein B
MAIAAAYGFAVAFAGWLAARALASGHRRMIASRLGLERRPTALRFRLPTPASLTAWAEARSWPGQPWTFVLALGLCAFAGAAVGDYLAGPVTAVAGAAGGPFVLTSILSRRSAAEHVRAEEHLQEAILALAAATRAGLSIRRAVEEAARDAGSPLDSELAGVIDRLEVGDSLEAALSRLGSRLELPDVGLVVTVLSLHRRTGGDLPMMLEQVAEVVGDRVRARREVRAITAQGRASGAILAVLPVAFVALLSGTGGEALGAFYRMPLGAGLLLAGLACEALGFWWIRRIVRRAEMAP